MRLCVKKRARERDCVCVGWWKANRLIDIYTSISHSIYRNLWSVDCSFSFVYYLVFIQEICVFFSMKKKSKSILTLTKCHTIKKTKTTIQKRNQSDNNNNNKAINYAPTSRIIYWTIVLNIYRLNDTYANSGPVLNLLLLVRSATHSQYAASTNTNGMYNVLRLLASFARSLVCLFLFLLHLFSAVDLIRPQSRQDKWHRWHLLHSQWASLQYIWCYYDLFSLPPRARAAVRRTMNCAWQFICSLVVLLTFRWRSFEDNKFLLTYHKTNHFRSMTRELLLGTF